MSSETVVTEARGTVDGTIRQVQSSWTTIQISAGNGSLFDLLSNDGTDAPVFRVFEIEPKLPSGTDAAYGNRIRKQLLDNAGHAGDIYLRYLTSPGVVDWVKARLDRRIEDVWDKLGPVRDQRQRIRVHFLACLWVGLRDSYGHRPAGVRCRPDHGLRLPGDGSDGVRHLRAEGCDRPGA